MKYDRFKHVLNKTIFEKSKADLLEKIASAPSRYIGLFRPTKPQGKILQNLLQSHEIRFGNAFEKIFQNYLEIIGFEILPNNFIEENLRIDQCFQKGGKIYFVEQKVRDDHDSSKKRGQIENFEKKLNAMLSKYSEQQLVGIFYFLDPELVKNKIFYKNEIDRMEQDYNIELHIFYGGEFFDFLEHPDIWVEIIQYLRRWKEEIPDMPEINFDKDPESTFEEIKDLKPLIFRKILSDDEIFNQIVLTLFPEKKTLRMLKGYFERKDEYIYKTLSTLIDKKLS